MPETFAARARAELLVIAEGYVGCADNEIDGARYRDLVAFGETPASAEAMGRESGCGLSIRGFWREYGLVDPRLEAPYKATKAIEDIVAMAREAAAWKIGHLDELAAGDVILLGGEEHVLTVVDVGAGFVHSIDGGQRTADGAEAVLSRTRKLLATPSGFQLVGAEGARPIMGYAS